MKKLLFAVLFVAGCHAQKAPYQMSEADVWHLKADIKDLQLLQQAETPIKADEEALLKKSCTAAGFEYGRNCNVEVSGLITEIKAPPSPKK